MFPAQEFEEKLDKMAAELQPLTADPDAKKADSGGAPKEKDPAPTIIPKVDTPIQVVPRNTEPPKVRGTGRACLPGRLLKAP